MQTLLRVVNLIVGPLLTLAFAAQFAGFTIAGKSAGDAIGGGLAGLIMLTVEMALTQGPKRWRWLRRWLDPRAEFEGTWVQEVEKGPKGNEVGVFSVDYEPEGDTFSVQGRAYSGAGEQWAKWRSTQMFIQAGQRKATYLWDGEILRKAPDADKSGLTTLYLRPPPGLSLPMTGEGRVSHVGEGTRLTFELRRVDNHLLRDLGLPFNERELRIGANNEDARLVAAYARKRNGRPPPLTQDAIPPPLSTTG